MPENLHNAHSDLSKLSFEETLRLLEETVQALEKGELTLDDATRLFEDGMNLARLCSEMLAAAELKITRIQTTYGEQIQTFGDESLES